ncbi:hypothetical protein GWK47_005994 [Chionoecetes opilio]|uniref:Uncharacterized protein n=1 Tax=Chionoecetes opilio TaxID=41210 RepID=A0A8J4YFV2_CHIOP|nr:hypothetical protein GWK47_005994 [Chionoecetes opilio]
MKERLNAVVRVLEGLANDCNADRAIDARGLLGQIDAGFAMKLAIMTHILGWINQLSNLLQSANLDMVKAVEFIETVRAHLEEMRSDPASFDALWDEVERNSTSHGFDTSECRMCRSPRKRKLPTQLQDCVVTDSIGKQSGSTHSDFSVKDSTRINFFYPILDHIST